MVFKSVIDSVTRARAYYLCKVQGLPVRRVAEMCDISRGSVSRITKEHIGVNKESAKKYAKGGPAFKLTERQRRQLLRAIVRLREREGNFCCKRIMQEAGVSETEVSVRTVRRFLNSQGYHYLQTRKKGLITAADMQKRLKFARKMLREYSSDIWTRQVAFYLDGTAFVYKTNPLDQARAPKARIWRRRGEGITTGCIAKGRKEGTGGKYVKLIVAISYDKGVIACDPYEKMSGHFFASYIEEHFPRMFQLADKGVANIFLQDNCPCQNSALAKAAMVNTNSHLLEIPPRSPDLNCLENLFPIVLRQLAKQATDLQITRESYDDFKSRVINAFQAVPIATVNKLIASMPNRISEVIAKKGGRMKY